MTNLDQLPIPYIMKDKVLMSPGVWNNYYYSKEVIEKMFKNTDWNNPRVRALFLDHVDDRTSEWVGEVKNVRLEDGNLIGDLIIVDKPTAIKLAYGAKFGVSPKVIGDADYNRRIYNGNFENFSIVINPAVKTTFLNSQVNIKGGEKMPEEEKETASEEAETEAETEEEEVVSPAESQIISLLKELKESIEELKKKKYPYPYKAKEETKEAKEDPYPYEKGSEEELKKKKKKYPYPYETLDEEFEKFLEENIENSAWTEFVAKYIKEHKGEGKPSELMKRAAKEFKKKSHKEVEVVKVEQPKIEELEEKIMKKVEQKFAEFRDPLGGLAQRYLSQEKASPEDLDAAVFELIRRNVV